MKISDPVPIMIISGSKPFRDVAYDHFDKLGYSVNLERDTEGAGKRVTDGLFKIVVVDLAVTAMGQDSRRKLPDWEWLWSALQTKWAEFKTPPKVYVVEAKYHDVKKEKIVKEMFLKSLEEIQALFYQDFITLLL